MVQSQAIMSRDVWHFTAIFISFVTLYSVNKCVYVCLFVKCPGRSTLSTSSSLYTTLNLGTTLVLCNDSFVSKFTTSLQHFF